MFRRIDESRLLSKFIESLSSLLAKQRGLPIVVGIALVVLSFVFQMIGVYAPSHTLEIIGIVVQHLGILIALVGLLLADPLGK